MLNTPVQAAAEGLPVSKKITRRAALCGIATLPAMGSATAALAAIPASADPWTRARALAAEIKAVLGEIDGVEGVDVSVSLDHGNAETLTPEKRVSGLSDLIDAHKAAYAGFMAALDAEEADRRNDSLKEASMDASDVEEAALCAILEYRPVSQADAIAKVAFLGPRNKLGCLDQQVHMDHLLASLLPAGEWLPPEWWGWGADYVDEVAS